MIKRQFHFPQIWEHSKKSAHNQLQPNHYSERAINSVSTNIRSNKFVYFWLWNLYLSFSSNKCNLNIGAAFYRWKSFNLYQIQTSMKENNNRNIVQNLYTDLCTVWWRIHTKVSNYQAEHQIYRLSYKIQKFAVMIAAVLWINILNKKSQPPKVTNKVTIMYRGVHTTITIIQK